LQISHPKVSSAAVLGLVVALTLVAVLPQGVALPVAV
jgi:hypothetical protein